MTLARAERAALSDTLEKTDPGQPTLCEGWTARDVLVHLLVRERQTWAVVGMVVPAFAPVTEQATRGYAGTPWAEMVDLLRSGPPPWSPFRLPRVDELADSAEFFVHHEDVRRGEPGWEPRDPDDGRDAELWALVTRLGRGLYRRSPVGLAVRRPGGEQVVIRTGRGLVTVEGEPGEILLHGFGRGAVRVEVRGEQADVAAFEAVPRGV